MDINEEYSDLRVRFESLLSDLDRLQLPFVAVHVDLALRRLESHLAGIGAEFAADQGI
jgi:hypothetical protein